MEKLLITFSTAIVRALYAFVDTFLPPTPSKPKLTGEQLAADLKAALVKADLEANRKVSPFKYHLKKHFTENRELSRTEIVENLLMSLTSLGQEITELTDGVVECSVENSDQKEGSVLHGHISWEVDKVSPVVYDIAIDLLKDGFIFRADTKTFVITSRIESWDS